MFSKLFKKKTHNKDGFPLTVKGHGYCIAWSILLHSQKEVEIKRGDTSESDKFSRLSPAEDKVAFAHHNVGFYSDDKSGLIDGLIPAIKIKGKVGLYELVDRYKRSNFTSDPASYDDCMEVDLKFIKSIILK